MTRYQLSSGTQYLHAYGSRDKAIFDLNFNPYAEVIAMVSLQEHEAQLSALQARVAKLEEAIRSSVPELQWVTNGIQMNETQHIRLGDAIACLYEALAPKEDE